jgi:predicted alpha/beta-fold hydrolase
MIPLKLDPCLPPFWAHGGHMQTLLGHLIPSQALTDPGKRVETDLGDGDRLVSFLLEGKSDLVIYLFHGLSGSIASDYVQRTARLGQSLGHSVFMVNHRGCGEGKGLAEKPYHSGRGEDLSAVIRDGKKLFPKRRHLAIGFSLGGNALLNLITGKRGTHKPDLAITVNAPIDLKDSAVLLQKGLNRIYDFRFVNECKRDLGDQYKISSLATMYDFDEIYTAPAAGFKNRDDYYQTCSTKDSLSSIDVPTIILTAQDDPFVNYQNYVQAKLSPYTQLHVETYGGHLGYLSRKKTPLGTHRWLDYALLRSIEALSS